jgi:hypothetical protein
MGQDEFTAHHLPSLTLVAAWRGEADACRGYARQANDLATSRRLGLSPPARLGPSTCWNSARAGLKRR